MISNMIQLLGDKQLRGLTFVHILNEQGIEPTVGDANAFVEAWVVNDFDPPIEGYFRDTVDYLLGARLLKRTSGTRLTLSPAGKALLNAANTKDSVKAPSAPVEVVGRMNDPFVYAELLTRIDDVGASLVIDPYLHPRDLLVLLELSSTNRFLTVNQAAAGLNKQARMDKFRISMGARPDKELRFATGTKDSRELHDRLVIPMKGGEAISMGTSLGGQQVTVITRLGIGATNALREHYNQIWDRSTRVEPIKREDTD